MSNTRNDSQPSMASSSINALALVNDVDADNADTISNVTDATHVSDFDEISVISDTTSNSDLRGKSSTIRVSDSSDTDSDTSAGSDDTNDYSDGYLTDESDDSDETDDEAVDPENLEQRLRALMQKELQRVLNLSHSLDKHQQPKKSETQNRILGLLIDADGVFYSELNQLLRLHFFLKYIAQITWIYQQTNKGVQRTLFNIFSQHAKDTWPAAAKQLMIDWALISDYDKIHRQALDALNVIAYHQVLQTIYTDEAYVGLLEQLAEAQKEYGDDEPQGITTLDWEAIKLLYNEVHAKNKTDYTGFLHLFETTDTRDKPINWLLDRYHHFIYKMDSELMHMLFMANDDVLDTFLSAPRDFSTVVGMVGSNRQDPQLDGLGAYLQLSGRYHRDFRRYIQSLAERMPAKTVVFDNALVSDFQNNLNPGTAMLSQLGPCFMRYKWDHRKILILYAFIHRMRCRYSNDLITVQFVDDLGRDIIDNLYHFFKSNPEMIPEGVSLELVSYVNGTLNPKRIIHGSGETDPFYSHSVKLLTNMMNQVQLQFPHCDKLDVLDALCVPNAVSDFLQ